MLEWSDSGIPGVFGEWAHWGDYLLCVQLLNDDEPDALYMVVDTVSDDRILTGEAPTVSKAKALASRFCLLIQNVDEERKAKIIKLSEFYS